MAASLDVRGPIRPLRVLSVLCGLVLVTNVVWADIGPRENETGFNRSGVSDTGSDSAPFMSVGGLRTVQEPVQELHSGTPDKTNRSRGHAPRKTRYTELESFDICFFARRNMDGRRAKFTGNKGQSTGWFNIAAPSHRNGRYCVHGNLPSVGPVLKAISIENDKTIHSLDVDKVHVTYFNHDLWVCIRSGKAHIRPRMPESIPYAAAHTYPAKLTMTVLCGVTLLMTLW